MKKTKTQTELVKELKLLRARLATLQESEREHEQTKETLAQERNILRTLIDSLPDYIYVKDTQSRFLVTNLANAQILRAKTPEDAIGKTDFDFYPHEEAAGYFADEQEIIGTGQPLVNREEMGTDLAGNPRWTLSTKVPLRDSRGKTVGLVGVGRDITERKWIEQEILRRNTELTQLYQIGQATSRLAAPDEVLGHVCRAIGKTLGNRNLFIALYDETNQHISFPMYMLEGERHPPVSRPFGNGLTEYVIRTKTPLLIDHDLQQVLADRGIDSIGRPARSFLAVPILAGEKAIGVIAIQDYESENAYSANDAELLGTIASQVASALENVRLFTETRRRVDEFAALYDITHDLAIQQDLPALLQTIVDRAAALLSAPGGGIYLYDAEREDLTLVAQKGIDFATGLHLRLGEGLAGFVAQTRQPMMVDDYSAGEYHSSRYQGIPITAVVQVPILYGGDLIGVLSVYEVEKPTRKFTESDARLLSLLAGQVAGAVHNVRLLTETRRRADELTALYDTTRDLGAQQDLPTLLKTIVERATTLLNVRSGFVYLFDAPRGDLELVVEQGFTTPLGTRLEMGEGMAGRVAQTRQALIVDNYRAWEHRSSKYEGTLITAVAQVPMLYGGALIGVLGIQEIETTTRKFTDADTRLLALFAGQAAGAVHNARLLAETQRRANELAALYDTTRDLATQYNLSTLLATMVDRATALLAAPGAFVYLYDPAQHNLELKLVKGVAVPLGTRLELGEGMAGRVAQSYQPLIIDDYRTWEHRSKKYDGIPFTAVLEVPMHYGGELIGVLAVNEIGSTIRKFTEAEARVLSLFAAQAASAVHNARLFEEANRRAERLAVLNRIARRLGATLQLDELLEIVHREITTVLPAEKFFIALYDQATDELNFRIRVDKQVHEPPVRRSLRNGLSELVVTSKKPLLIRDLEHEQEHLPRLRMWGTMQAPRSWLGVPIMLGDNVIGVISVQSYRPNAYGQPEQELLSTIADAVAVAIENARLYEAEKRRSARLTDVSKLGIELATLRDEKSVLNLLVTRASTIEDSPACTVMLVDTTTNQAVVAAQTGLPEGALGLRVPLSLPIIRHALETGEPIILADIDRDAPEIRTVLVRKDIRAFFAYPMMREGRILGFITLSKLTPHTPSQGKIAAYQLLAERAAAALENVRLLEETRQRLAEMEAVNRISTALRAAQSLDEMLPILLGGILSALDCQAGAIWLYDREKEVLQPTVSRGWFKEVVDSHGPGEGVIGHVFSTGQTYDPVEFKTDPYVRDSARSKIPAQWGGAIAPIRSTQEIIGILAISVQHPRVVTGNETRLLTTVAEIAGNAIQRTRFHEQTEQQLQRLDALHTIDKTITSSLDLTVTLGVILTQITRQLRVDAASVLLLNPHTKTLEYAAGHGFRTRAFEHSSLQLGEGYAGRVAMERQIVSVPNLAEHPDDLLRTMLIAGEGFISYFGVPLIAKGQIKGVLEIFHRSPFAAAPDWQDFLETLSEQTAIAIDSIGLFNDLQRSNMELSLAYDTTLEGWSRALDLRDRETEGHTQRVVELTLRLAREMGISESELVHIRRGVLLHDIGKMGVSDSILHKPGPLTAEEKSSMYKHPEYAYEMLAPIRYLQRALEVPYCHHEKWDGTGYPRRLKEEQIPLAARIFAVVDVWDALLSGRPYRAAWPEDQVRAYIREQSGQHFDPRVVEAFFQVVGSR